MRVKKVGEELIVEKKEYGFRLIIGSQSYFVNDKGDYFNLIIENENEEIIDVVPDRYENLGVKDLQELLCKTITDPSEMLKMLIGEELEIEKIVVEFD